MINIFIHGTLFFALKLPFASSFFSSPQGLFPVSKLPNSYQIKKVATMLNNRNSTKFPINNFYSYGWSGQLSSTTRNLAAHEIYHVILNLTNNYKAKIGRIPKIRIITHSHGGNIALQLGKWARYHQDKNFQIDELILLACPVQFETKNYVKDKCFKKIYSLFSYADLIQIADPQGLIELKNIKIKNWWKKLSQKPIFSERVFPRSNNLIQANITLNRYRPIHIDFLRLKFFKALPDILHFLDLDRKKPFLRKAKSGEVNLKLLNKNR